MAFRWVDIPVLCLSMDCPLGLMMMGTGAMLDFSHQRVSCPEVFVEER